VKESIIIMEARGVLKPMVEERVKKARTSKQPIPTRSSVVLAAWPTVKAALRVLSRVEHEGNRK
jgi:hypothetical protein